MELQHEVATDPNTQCIVPTVYTLLLVLLTNIYSEPTWRATCAPLEDV